MLEVFNPINAMDNIQAFLVAGGNVLLVIMIVTFALWMLVIERVLYFVIANSGAKKRAVTGWSDRTDTNSWYALSIREKRLSVLRQDAFRNISAIKVLIAVLPLLGLLGTVTGMVDVFDIMASTGSSNARLMAGGITKATIPTMAGLVASLSGIFMLNILERQAASAVTDASDKLVIG